MNKISIEFGQEELISRVPGLFAYIEFDDNGVSHMYPAHESITGCYGHIAAGITIPSDIVSECEFDGTVISLVEPGNTYSYQTIMDYYYQYYEEATTNDTFMAFVDKGIGKIYVDIDIDFEECDLVPEYVYMAECGEWYNIMTKMKKTIDNYLEVKNITGEINCEMECLIDKYNRMGGDAMKQFYYDNWQASIGIADEYYGYASDSLPTINCDLCVVRTEKDLGYMSTYINYFVPGDIYHNGDIVTYNGRSYICTAESTRGRWNTDYEEYEFDPDSFSILTESYELDDDSLEGTTSSKLSGFRRKKNFIDYDGSVDIPETDTDWLFYYRVGSLGHYETETDEYGNITIMDGYTRNETIGEDETHLMAYGDILTKIKYNVQDRSISFEYVIGANLKAELKEIGTDDDGNNIYKYGDYSYNANDSHGVLCSEIYYYDEGSEIEELITNGDFYTYISKDTPSAQYLYKRMAFDTSRSSMTVTTNYNGTPTTFTTNYTNFTTKIDNPKDSLIAPLTKLDYLVGITYPPYVDNDIYASRGNAASWERHMKLGEIKTFDDLETYSNGGFFNIL